MRNRKRNSRDPIQMFIIGAHQLTEYQMRIISLSQHGLQRKEMAYALGITLHTIDTHMTNIYKLLKLKGCMQLAVWSLKNECDEFGCYKGQYLFANYSGLPWDNSAG
jgi:DNA-binding CsgD family transcriptional regulator